MTRMETVRPFPERMTREEFYAWDDGTDTVYELIEGEVVPMASPLVVHSEIAANVTFALKLRVRRPFRVSAQSGVEVGLATWRVADVAVARRPSAPDRRALDEPVVLVEVLSPSTEDEDLGRKRRHYQTLPSVEELLFVAAQAIDIELVRRAGSGWMSERLTDPAAVVELRSIGVSFTVSALYAGTFLDPEDTL